MVVYGIVHATASLSCTLPAFLAAVISALSVPGAGFMNGVAASGSYGVGTGIVLTVLALSMGITAQQTWVLVNGNGSLDNG
jgi:cytochrome c biogenesis protein CcdA